MRTARPLFLLFILSLLAGCVTRGQAQTPAVITVRLPSLRRVRLAPSTTISAPAIGESSGLVESRSHPGRFWTHNDSGNSPEIFALDATGKLIGSPIRVEGAVNTDWEDIATDGEGHLLIADLGNNANMRRDLSIYVIPEPDPLTTTRVRVIRKISVFYPEQTGFPGLRWNFDAEALFEAHGSYYILTKDRSDSYTTLYRLDDNGGDDPQPLTRLATFNIRGMVTGADATPDGRTIAVLTYTGIWLFELSPDQPADSDDYFHGRIRRLPILAKQCEGICFDGDTLVISNEQRDLFRVPLSRLVPVSDGAGEAPQAAGR